MITANADGAVNLYHNNSKKFETSSTGGTISGTSGAALVIQATDANTYPGINLINDAQRYDLQIDGSSDSFRIYDNTNSTTRVVLDTSGNLLVGSTNNSPATNNVAGSSHGSLGNIQASVDGNPCLFVNRKSNDGDIVSFRKDGSAVGSIGANGGYIYVGSDDVNLRFHAAAEAILPATTGGTSRDDAIDIGTSSARFDDIYATNGTIQTSDRNEKQDIAALTSTEMLVAKRISALFKTYRWKSKVATKGDDARTHSGIIAQDVQTAFAAESLDAGDYGMFISTTWTNDDGDEQTRMGIRYPELLSFLAAYNEQRFAAIETRLTALEG
jgi:hypothetical protein